jgi:hypothetical protein
MTPSLPWKCSTAELRRRYGSDLSTSNPVIVLRAGDGTRTRDPQLGRLMLYQLSYSRQEVSPSPDPTPADSQIQNL